MGLSDQERGHKKKYFRKKAAEKKKSYAEAAAAAAAAAAQEADGMAVEGGEAVADEGVVVASGVDGEGEAGEAMPVEDAAIDEGDVSASA